MWLEKYMTDAERASYAVLRGMYEDCLPLRNVRAAARAGMAVLEDAAEERFIAEDARRHKEYFAALEREKQEAERLDELYAVQERMIAGNRGTSAEICKACGSYPRKYNRKIKRDNTRQDSARNLGKARKDRRHDRARMWESMLELDLTGLKHAGK